MKILTLMMIATMTVMAGATIAPILPAIQKSFGGIPNVTFLTKMLLSLTALFTALSAPLAGKLADRYGRRPIVLSAILLYGVAGSAGLYLDSLTLLLVTRALLGIAVGALMTMATTLVAEYFEGPQQVKMMGVKGAAASFGGVLFLSLGGLLAEAGWRLPFLIYLLSFAIFPMAYIAITEPNNQKTRPQQKVSLDLNLIKKLLPSYSIAFFSMMFFYMIPTQIPFLLQDNFQASGSHVAQIISLSAVVGGIVASFYQRITLSLKPPMILGLSWASMGIAFTMIGQATGLTHIYLSMLAAGMGYGLFMPTLSLLVVQNSQDSYRGVALGFLTTMLFLGQFFSPILIKGLESVDESIFMSAGLILMTAPLLSVLWGLRRFISTLFPSKKTTTALCLCSCD